MKFGTSKFHILTLLLLALFSPSANSATPFENLIKDAAIRNGFLAVSQIEIPTNVELSSIGQLFFESKNLGNNRDIACVDCHLDEFSSADGIPLAIGVNGLGIGLNRVLSEGEVIPRNTLALWGRGHKEFSTFFWDGRVETTKEGELLSQFGELSPSNDPLVVAVHLPAVEIKEMLIETNEVQENKQETLSNAESVFSYLLSNLKQWEADAIQRLAMYEEKSIDDLKFLDVAESIAEFIRFKFRPKSTKFHKFVFDGQSMTTEEVEGARIFYGKGKCSTCHSGPYFSDFDFHTIPFTQLGSGKNGFGIDYGRYNTTHNPSDLYKFRTPPLLNVADTFPYGHSGSVESLEAAIRYHFDPLSNSKEIAEFSPLERTEYYRILTSANESLLMIPFLDNDELSKLTNFLRTLSF